MPSRLAPTITNAQDTSGNNIPNNGTVSGSGLTLSGLGFPGLKLNISIATNGTPQTPSAPYVQVDANGDWKVNLTGLSAGATIVTLTEDATNIVVIGAPGVVSQSFTVTLNTTVFENFTGLNGVELKYDWVVLSDRDVGIWYLGANTGFIFPARLVWPDSALVGAEEQRGNIFSISHAPTNPELSTSFLALFLRKSKALINTTFSEVSFKYTSSVDCVAYLRDEKRDVINQKSLPASLTTPVKVTLAGADATIIEIVTPPINPSTWPGWSTRVGAVEFTITP